MRKNKYEGSYDYIFIKGKEAIEKFALMNLR